MALCFGVRRCPGVGGVGDVGEQFLFSGGRDGLVKAWDAKRSLSLPVLVYDMKRVGGNVTLGHEIQSKSSSC